MMNLSAQQFEALDQINSWRASRNAPHYFLGGYAGTGKTTLVRHFLDQLDEKTRARTLVMTPTGKAADVLRKKGVANACTVHSAIYSPISPAAQRIDDLRCMLRAEDLSQADRQTLEMELGALLADDGPSFTKGGKEFLEEMKLLICDEFSMVGSSMYEDIIETGIPLLAIGDPAQLPPVKDGRLPFQPDFTLTEIHRQAEGNPIIQLAHKAKRGEPLEIGDYGDCRVVGPDEYKPEMLLEHDQIVCYTHDVRRHINAKVRERTGKTDVYPMAGEKIVCKKNDPELKLWNGAMYKAASNSRQYGRLVTCDVHNGIEALSDLTLYSLPFEEYRRRIKDHERLSYQERRGMSEFDYGYAITCHSAQGSEWDSVLVADETHKMRSEQEKRQWLYTAITRAAKRITIYKTKG